MAFRKLFVKEWRSLLPLYGVFAVAVLLLDLFLLFKSDSWKSEVISGVALILPYTLAAAIAIGSGYYQLHTEWRTNSIYLLLSLPVKGWKILSAKLAAVFSLLILTCLWIGGSYAILLLPMNWSRWEINEGFRENGSTILNIVANAFWLYLLVIGFFIVIVQFAYLCGQLVAKFKWLVVFGAFCAAIWVMIRVSPLVSALLQWTPDIVVGGDGLEVSYLRSGAYIGLVLLCAALVWLNGYIFEKEVEV